MRRLPLALALVLAGCASTASGPASPPAFPYTIDAVVRGVPEADVAARAPVDVTRAPNRHVEGAEDTYRTYRFDGVALTYLYAEPVDRTFFLTVVVDAPGVQTPAGIGVGSPRADVEAAYGEPVSATDDGQTLFSYEGPEAEGSYTFAARFGVDGRVASFSVTHDVD